MTQNFSNETAPQAVLFALPDTLTAYHRAMRDTLNEYDLARIIDVIAQVDFMLLRFRRNRDLVNNAEILNSLAEIVTPLTDRWNSNDPKTISIVKVNQLFTELDWMIEFTYTSAKKKGLFSR